MQETTLRSLFSNPDRRYEVPAYQRAYSWGEEQIDQLLQDLRDARGDYYLGHFLFQEPDAASGGAASHIRYIIDGQQRLTTCVIFFSALHSALTQRQAAGATVTVNLRDMEHIYLRDFLHGTQKLQTSKDDNNFFAAEIVDRKPATHSQPATLSQGRIRAARERFAAAFAVTEAPELERWRNLIEGAVCTQFPVADIKAAARIFGFQNDRGVDLTQLERLKSFFLLQIYLHGGKPAARQEHLGYIEKDISTIYHVLAQLDLREDDVLRYCWQASSSSAGFGVREPLKEIKAHVVGGGSEKVCERIRNFMSALAEAFRLVAEIETSTAIDIVHLRALNSMALAYPFLIRARIEGVDAAGVIRLARALENVLFRAKLRGGRAEIQTRLNDLLRKHSGAAFSKSLVENLVRELRSKDGWWGYWSDAVFDELTSGYFYGKPVDNYLLWRYEEYLVTGSGYGHSLKVGSIHSIPHEAVEHIAPVTESSGGAAANGYGAYDVVEPPNTGIRSGEWLNCLGNLVLISRSDNSSYGNCAFADKLAGYGKDNLLLQQKEIEKFVADAQKPVWDWQAIDRRLTRLVAAAKEMWSLDAI